MSIDKTFMKLGERGEGALIAYITGGDPSPKHTPSLVEALIKGGADIIEIGIPFSDPIADGPVIQAASCRALSAGVTPLTIFDIVKDIKRRQTAPVVLMTYYNVLYKMGVGNFLEEAKAHGVDGLIIPDLPVEEAREYHKMAGTYGIDTIFLATPLTSLIRLNHILGFTSGFLYLASALGTTGTRDALAEVTIPTVKRLRRHIANTVPLAVGFGISKPEHVSAVIGSGADGAIVGSAFVKKVEANLNDPTKMADSLTELAKSLKEAMFVPLESLALKE